jgi:hypothetical protein
LSANREKEVMDLESVSSNGTSKQVIVTNVLDGTTDSAILDFALSSANEKRHSIFDYCVIRGDYRSVVLLYTD